jgi:hypothetical protein
VRSLPEETVSPSFDEAFRPRLAAAAMPAARLGRRFTALPAAAGLAAVLVLALLGVLASRRGLPPDAMRTESVQTSAPAREVPRWLAACAAPTAGDCRHESPCASAATCGADVLVSTVSAGRFSETSPPAFARPQ